MTGAGQQLDELLQSKTRKLISDIVTTVIYLQQQKSKLYSSRQKSNSSKSLYKARGTMFSCDVVPAKKLYRKVEKKVKQFLELFNISCWIQWGVMRMTWPRRSVRKSDVIYLFLDKVFLWTFTAKKINKTVKKTQPHCLCVCLVLDMFPSRDSRTKQVPMTDSMCYKAGAKNKHNRNLKLHTIKWINCFYYIFSFSCLDRKRFTCLSQKYYNI